MSDWADETCSTCSHPRSAHGHSPQGEYCTVQECGCVDGHMMEKRRSTPDWADEKAEELYSKMLTGTYFEDCVPQALRDAYQKGAGQREALKLRLDEIENAIKSDELTEFQKLIAVSAIINSLKPLTEHEIAAAKRLQIGLRESE